MTRIGCVGKCKYTKKTAGELRKHLGIRPAESCSRDLHYPYWEDSPSSGAIDTSALWLRTMIDSGLAGRGTTRAQDAQGTPTQSDISPSIIAYDEYMYVKG